MNLWRGGRKKIKTKTKRGQRTKIKKKTKKGHGGTFREVKKTRQKREKTKRGQRNLWRGKWEQILRKRKDIRNLWSGKN